MDAATDEESITAYVEQILAGTGWSLDALRRRGTRLEPPDWFWMTFAADVHKRREKQSLRLVAKGALHSEAWDRLLRRLPADDTERPSDPIHGVGYPRVFPDTRHVYWFYPYDPRMPNLPAAADAGQAADILFGPHGNPRKSVDVQRVRYTPEIGAILRYTFDAAGVPATIYGKVQPGQRGLRTHRIVEALWQAAANYPGYLNLPRPLGYVEEMGLLLEEGVRGAPVSGNRRAADFALMPDAAADALAVIHESGVQDDERIEIEAELRRLDDVAEKFTYVLPEGHFLLRDLVVHMRDIVRKGSEEEWLPTHGDLKYDQFVFHNESFTLLDFDYFAMAETSYDLGKFCAYLVPSHPRDWRDSAAAEEARLRFIRRYRELRPHATLHRFGVYESLQLALRAMAFMWAQTHGWQRVAETFLVLAYERLKSRLPE